MKRSILLIIAIVTCQLAVMAQVKGDNNTQTVQKQVTLKGTFSSKKGVMHEVSCYGSNVGIITSDDKTTTTYVSFDKLKNSANLKMDCAYIEVTGYYESKTIDGSGSCMANTKTIFYVEKWKCIK